MHNVVHRRWSTPYLAQGPIYLDSSVVVGFLTSTDRFHSTAVQFIGDHVIANVQLNVSLLTIDEVMWRLAKGFVARGLGKRPNQVQLGKLVKRGPSVLAPYLPALRSAINQVTTWADLMSTQSDPHLIIDRWFDRLLDVGGNHDALHLVLAQDFGAKTLVTTDADFQKLKKLPFPLEVLLL